MWNIFCVGTLTFNFCEWISKNIYSLLENKQLFNFVNECQNVFQSVSCILHSLQDFTLFPYQSLTLLVLWIWLSEQKVNGVLLLIVACNYLLSDDFWCWESLLSVYWWDYNIFTIFLSSLFSRHTVLCPQLLFKLMVIYSLIVIASIYVCVYS